MTFVMAITKTFLKYSILKLLLLYEALMAIIRIDCYVLRGNFDEKKNNNKNDRRIY